jgi:hypothetical protein
VAAVELHMGVAADDDGGDGGEDLVKTFCSRAGRDDLLIAPRRAVAEERRAKAVDFERGNAARKSR